ncbi:sce7726 family protein [Microbacterium sp. A1-JK]|uniref:sce7726 family protein n=1 Tax=Microbacterium sp. A1-JK TaxID=3177516 RepID=UPI003886F24B
MKDADVRVALHRWLLQQHAAELDDTRVVDELGIAGEVRVDTVVLNGSFAGFEIKSARDTLRRLPKQVEVYSAVLDYATLVVASNHIAHARSLLPRWWGIVEARADGDEVKLVPRRKPRRNSRINAFMLCTLLWRAEALEELDAVGAARGYRSKPNAVLWERLATVHDPEALRTIVRERLKVRPEWRAGAA